MARSGPVTKDTSTAPIGLMQIRIGNSADNIAKPGAELTSSNSIGALANTKYVGNTDWANLESGFPLIKDLTVPIREAAAIECAFKEVTPETMALAHGTDISGGGYSSHTGEVTLGSRSSPDYVRMEAVQTYPNGTNTMTFIFPRAQISANVEFDTAEEEFAAVPIVIESTNASSDVSGGDAIWDDMSLGHIIWA